MLSCKGCGHTGPGAETVKDAMAYWGLAEHTTWWQRLKAKIKGKTL